MPAPMRLRTSMTPLRVGLHPTPRITRSEPRIAAAATRKKAAEERSPGTRTSLAERRWPPSTTTDRSLSTFNFTPKAWAMISVWSRDFCGSFPTPPPPPPPPPPQPDPRQKHRLFSRGRGRPKKKKHPPKAPPPGFREEGVGVVKDP